MSNIHIAHCKRNRQYSAFAYEMVDNGGYPIKMSYTARNGDTLEEALKDAIDAIIGPNQTGEYTIVQHGRQNATLCENFSF
jgi:hypothetical protein